MTLNETIEQFKALPPTIIIVAAVLLVVLLFGLRLLFKKPPSHLVAFSGEAGSVHVSRKALQELIKQVCLTNECVESVSPRIKIAGDQVNTHATLRLRTPENLKENCERIQNDITNLLQKSLNFDQIGAIEIVVSSFTNNSEAKSSPEESHETAPRKNHTFDDGEEESSSLPK